MAFTLASFYVVGPDTGPTRQWRYDTSDSIATVAASGYFTNARNQLRVGDTIDVNFFTGSAITTQLSYLVVTRTDPVTISAQNSGVSAGTYNVRDYGATGDGVTADCVAIQACFTAALAANASMLMPPGTYLCNTQVTLTASATATQALWAYGASIKSTHAGSGLAITGGTTVGKLTVYGLRIDHQDQATPTSGFNLSSTWNVTLQDCSVNVHGNSASYPAIRLRNGTASDDSTGCFWTRIRHFTTRSTGSGSATEGLYGILATGAANHTVIDSCNFGNVDSAIYLTYEVANNTIPEGVTITHNNFEGTNYGITIDTTGTSTVSGHVIAFNRAELRSPAGTSIFFRIIGTATGNYETIPFLIGNEMITSTVGTYVDNTANAIPYVSFDFAFSPTFLGPRFTLRGEPFRMQQLDSAQHVLKLVNPQAAATPFGIIFRSQFDDDLGSLAADNNGLFTSKIQSISGTATYGNNLRGSATFTVSVATKTVTFTTNEPDATYFIALSANLGETVWVTAKATTGFTLNRTAVATTPTVDWVLIR